MLTAPATLTDLFENHQGRVIHKFPHHLEIYEKLFRPMAGEMRALTLLEIGVADGGSLQLWRNYFGGDAVIIGVDIQDRTKLEKETGAKILMGDQGDSTFLDLVAKQVGEPDIIIDDGSHASRDQIASFKKLFPLLRDGGLYVVEDIHTSYREFYGGGLFHPGSFVEFLKRMIDHMHASEHGWVGDLSVDYSHIFSVQVYPNLAVIEKRSPNTWGGSTMRPA